MRRRGDQNLAVCNSLLTISSDSLNYSSERCWYFFFLTEQEHGPPSAAERPVFGDTEGTSTCTRKGIGLTHLQPFPWQNASPRPDCFRTSERSCRWQWVVVMSWAFPWQQTLCQPPWCPSSCSGRAWFTHTWEAALGSGLELWHFSVLAQEGCQLWKAMGQHFRAANAESSCSCSDVSLGCYQLPLKTRFLLQLQWLKNAICRNREEL